VDDPIFEFLKNAVIDCDSIRGHVMAERERRCAEAQSYLEQAEAEEGVAHARLARVRRDYLEGAISAGELHEFESELREELDATKAKASLMSEQLHAIQEIRVPSDAVLELLARFRAAVSGRVQDAPSTRGAPRRPRDHL
jgi:hypothetical protein